MTQVGEDGGSDQPRAAKVARGWIPANSEESATRHKDRQGWREREEEPPGFRRDWLEGRTTVHGDGKTTGKVGAGGKGNRSGSSYSATIFPEVEPVPFGI